MTLEARVTPQVARNYTLLAVEYFQDVGVSPENFLRNWYSARIQFTTNSATLRSDVCKALFGTAAHVSKRFANHFLRESKSQYYELTEKREHA